MVLHHQLFQHSLQPSASFPDSIYHIFRIQHQAGFNCAVASLGTAFTSGQANIIKRYTDNVILSYDSDAAGTKAALRAIGILKEVGITAKVLDLKPHKDPDEFIKAKGVEAFEERIEKSLSLLKLLLYLRHRYHKIR